MRVSTIALRYELDEVVNKRKNWGGDLADPNQRRPLSAFTNFLISLAGYRTPVS